MIVSHQRVEYTHRIGGVDPPPQIWNGQDTNLDAPMGGSKRAWAPIQKSASPSEVHHADILTQNYMHRYCRREFVST